MSSHPFVPPGFSPPTALDHRSFRLRPLGPEHNERDHAAWSGSIGHIRATPGYPNGDWPHPMSSDDNLADLQRHHDDFERRVGFTFTVLAPDGALEEADVLGCVYLYPSQQDATDVHVRSWVREDHAHLDAPLAAAVRSWVDGDAWPWPSDRVLDHPRRARP